MDKDGCTRVYKQRSYAESTISVHHHPFFGCDWHLNGPPPPPIAVASPEERPKLLVICVAVATYWVIFCNFPGGTAIDAVDGEVHI